MQHKGVRSRAGKIQINFTPPGERSRAWVTLDNMSDTPANLARAAKLREEIRLKCKFGTFRWKEYFPDDPRAQQVQAGTYHTYAQSWLNSPENNWSKRTRYKYKGIITRVWNPSLHDRRIDLITYSELIETLTIAISEYQQDHNKKEPSISTYNDWLTCVRGPFKMAVMDGAIARHENPCEQLNNKTRPEPLPDPFDVDEAETIIASFYKHEAIEYAAYIEFSFFSGVRTPSEPTALLWPEVSLRKNEVRICRKRTKNGVEDGTKTGANRIVDLNARSRNAINVMKEISGFKKAEVFVHPSGGPIINPERLQQAWTRTLNRENIRHRRMYDMRHSYACYYLEEGCSPGYLSSQMGNSLKEFFRSYAHWITRANKDTQSKIMRSATPSATKSVAKMRQRRGAKS